MRKSILAMTAIAFAISAPIAAQAQSDTTGLARGGSVGVEGINQEQLPAFREYVIHERIPNHTVIEHVIVGTVLLSSLLRPAARTCLMLASAGAQATAAPATAGQPAPGLLPGEPVGGLDRGAGSTCPANPAKK